MELQELLPASKRKDFLIRHGWQDLLKSEAGRALMYELIGICGVYQQKTIEDRAVQFEEGKRSIGLRLITMCQEADSDSYVKMIQEEMSRIKEIEREIQNANAIRG